MTKDDMPEPLIIILKEMCDRVGADFEKVKFYKDNWFWEYGWTGEEARDFKEWFKNYLKEDREASDLFLGFFNSRNERYLNRLANTFLLQYGWKLRKKE